MLEGRGVVWLHACGSDRNLMGVHGCAWNATHVVWGSSMADPRYNTVGFQYVKPAVNTVGEWLQHNTQHVLLRRGVCHIITACVSCKRTDLHVRLLSSTIHKRV